MKRSEKLHEVGRISVAAILVAVSVLGACAAGTILKWSDVDTTAATKMNAAREKFNVIRFQTYGPEAEQVFGYFLYKDGIEVVSGGGPQVAKLGKMTLSEVMADYGNVRKTRMYSSGSDLLLKEILRGGTVAGYTATDIGIEVGIWDVTPAGRESGAVLQLVYDDKRGQHDGGTYRGRFQSGD